MKLNEDSIRWAIKHIKTFDDTDLFPLPKEFNIIWNNTDEFVNMVKDIDLTTFTWNSGRRFIVPKAELSYRVVTQLSPLDSIIFAAIIQRVVFPSRPKKICLHICSN